MLIVHHFAFRIETVLENIKVRLRRNKLCRHRGEKEFWATVLPLTFRTTRTAELSAWLPRKFLGTRFCYRLRLQSYWMRTEGISNLKISKGSTGNWTRNLPSYGSVPQLNEHSSRKLCSHTMFSYVPWSWRYQF